MNLLRIGAKVVNVILRRDGDNMSNEGAITFEEAIRGLLDYINSPENAEEVGTNPMALMYDEGARNVLTNLLKMKEEGDII
ncbi:hypothetical protein LC76P1_00014 [Lysinibacillus phage LC76P1]|nr:hypothetical protein LC76P1_00014 [Lysinibacillus phage LC76P1]